ncbi:hypothetical protein [Fodinibius sp.]|uniref:hypothetical protein n=1 Tax=Fodinibius sp. TaxID=1872440 RepID=UPI002ACD9828|nr:hypothetical protein [Fodinibius sp.]MDZ7659138.1 hypothetical protein [Fodinibius sp.]
MELVAISFCGYAVVKRIAVENKQLMRFTMDPKTGKKAKKADKKNAHKTSSFKKEEIKSNPKKL